MKSKEIQTGTEYAFRYGGTRGVWEYRYAGFDRVTVLAVGLTPEREAELQANGWLRGGATEWNNTVLIQFLDEGSEYAPRWVRPAEIVMPWPELLARKAEEKAEAEAAEARMARARKEAYEVEKRNRAALHALRSAIGTHGIGHLTVEEMEALAQKLGV
jgi:hypothetical protein